MTRTEALQALTKFEALTRGFGYPDEEALRKTKQIIWALRHGPVQDSNS